MGELNFGEAPIEDIGEGPAEHDSDNPKAVVDENDRLEDFNENEGGATGVEVVEA